MEKSQTEYLREDVTMSLINRRRQEAKEKFKKAYGISDATYDKWIGEQEKTLRDT